MPQCSVFGCCNKSGINREFTYHQFPCREKQRKIYRQWLAAINRKNWTPTVNAKVCSKHFKESDYERDYAAELLGRKRKMELKQGKNMLIYLSIN